MNHEVLPTGWRVMPLERFVKLQRGYDLPEHQRRPGDVPVMGSAGLTGFHDEAMVKGPGVVIGRSGASFGVVSYCATNYWPLNTVLYVADFFGNNERFAGYLLQGIDFSAFNSGSAQPSLNRNFLAPIPVKIPDRSEQDGISDVLGALDTKIDLNRRMNDTLEAIARAIFRSWFVDFDPVRDGDPTFPRGFESSALGPIPKGWTLMKLDEVVAVNPRSVTSSYPCNEIQYVDISSVREGRLEHTQTVALADAPSRAQRLVTHGDTIWSCVRPNRRSFLFIHEPPENVVVSTGFAVLSPREIPSSYLYHWVTTDDFVEFLTANADGSAYPAVRPSTFGAADVLVPSGPILERFHDLAGPVRARIACNEEESRALAALRDTLLPKLLSGEIRVKEAEKRVGAAV